MWVKEGIEAKMLLRLFGGLDMAGYMCYEMGDMRGKGQARPG